MRAMAREAVCAAIPLAFSFIPVAGMLWISAPELPPPGVSLVRIAIALAAVVIPLYLLLRRRSALIASNALGLPLLVLGLYPAAHSATSALVRNEAILAWIYVALCVACGWIARRLSGEAAATLHDVLTTVAVVFLVFTGWLLFNSYVRPASHPPAVEAAMNRLLTPFSRPTAPIDWRPDVYDLVLDGMARPDVLQQEYGLAPGGVLDEFHRLGFEFAANSRANYAQTQLSLASMLNAGYLDELAKAEGATGRQRGPLRDLISKGRVPAFFKDIGYRVEFIGSGYLSSGAFERADVCDCPQLWFADAEVGALSLSPLKVFFGGVGIRAHFERSLKIFDEIERRRPGSEPRYVFAHVPMPHPPFVADERGAFTNPGSLMSGGDGSFFAGSPGEYNSGYRAQAAFVLSRTLRAAARILRDGASTGRDIIFVVHGDHGPRRDFDALNPTAESGHLALPTLLAIRWPAGHGPSAPPASLVNVYRVLLDRVFGVDAPLLEDRGYVSAFDKPYDLIPVPLVNDASR